MKRRLSNRHPVYSSARVFVCIIARVTVELLGVAYYRGDPFFLQPRASRLTLFVYFAHAFRMCTQFEMPVLLSTGDFGNRRTIELPNGLTGDLDDDRSVQYDDIVVNDESVQLQARNMSVYAKEQPTCPTSAFQLHELLFDFDFSHGRKILIHPVLIQIGNHIFCMCVFRTPFQSTLLFIVVAEKTHKLCNVRICNIFASLHGVENLLLVLYCGMYYTCVVSPPRELFRFYSRMCSCQNPRKYFRPAADHLNLDNGVWLWMQWVSHDGVIVQLTFPVFVMALMSFLGWILFVFFGGLGLVGIPVDSVRVRCRCQGLSSTPQGGTMDHSIDELVYFFFHERCISVCHMSWIAIASL